MSKPPYVVFGPEIWSLQSEGGISRYFQQLIQGLSQSGIGGQILTSTNSNPRLEALDVENFQFRGLQNSENLYSEISRILEDEIGGVVYHPTYYSKNLVKVRAPRTKVVLTVFDMISELFPERKPRFRKVVDEKRISVYRADHILSISEQTKRDLINIYEVPEEKISVTYLGSDLHLLPKVENVVATKKDFMLYVGKREGYKNFSNFVTAFSHSKILMTNFEIIAVGGGNFSSSELSDFLKLGIADKVIHMDANDHQLAMLYRNASCLVYPSIYEGFGLPPVEAMSLNCPVIASSGGSIPEICGQAAAYFDPLSIDSIVHTILETLTSPSRIKDMQIKGQAASQLFTWERTARDTLSIYKRFDHS
jgi:glycosyltransferase involved in cell wall biosynthesis